MNEQFLDIVFTNSEYGLDTYKLDLCTQKWQLVHEEHDLRIRKNGNITIEFSKVITYYPAYLKKNKCVLFINYEMEK